jgi:predicted neuraminidase
MTRRNVLALAAAAPVLAQKTFAPTQDLIFPPEPWHNHSSSIVELPNGDLLVCWFHGSGERTADDVKILGARKLKSTGQWTAPFEMADTPGFPDTNCTMFVDSKQRLWLFWPVILANQWESALMKYKMTADLSGTGAPKWTYFDNILLKPKNLLEQIQRHLPESEHKTRLVKDASIKLTSRLGWFTRTHPVELPSGRILLPLYSDGFDFSLIGISDDGGQTWYASEPIVGLGNIQPSIVRKKDGTLVAYMRDNGPPPKRIHFSMSKDEGLTWSPAADTELPNPGTSVEAISLRSGNWIIVYNDLEKGRHSLAISMSDDEGATWKWKRHLGVQEKSQFHYPSVIQAKDGSIHVTYSYFVPEGKSIRHARFDEGWVKASA